MSPPKTPQLDPLQMPGPALEATKLRRYEAQQKQIAEELAEAEAAVRAASSTIEEQAAAMLESGEVPRGPTGSAAALAEVERLKGHAAVCARGIEMQRAKLEVALSAARAEIAAALETPRAALRQEAFDLLGKLIEVAEREEALAAAQRAAGIHVTGAPPLPLPFLQPLYLAKRGGWVMGGRLGMAVFVSAALRAFPALKLPPEIAGRLPHLIAGPDLLAEGRAEPVIVGEPA